MVKPHQIEPFSLREKAILLHKKRTFCNCLALQTSDFMLVYMKEHIAVLRNLTHRDCEGMLGHVFSICVFGRMIIQERGKRR